MRFSLSVLPLALAVAPSLVSAAGTLGFALGTKNADGSCKSRSDYEADFDAISTNSGSKLVRGYSASDCNFAQNALPAAKNKGFQVILGIWPDVDKSFNDDKAAISAVLGSYGSNIYAVTVGSETLYRGNFTGDTLAAKIKDVKNLVGSNIKVGTADSWNKYADGTADAVIKSQPDILLVNAFGFWQGQDISNATHTYIDDIMQAFQHIKTVAGANSKIEVWTGETGWPGDGGSNFKAAKAGTQNAATYFSSAICGMVKWGFNVFAFEAFDEPWKPASVGDDGLAAVETTWGVMDVNRKPKFNLKC